MLGKIIDKLEQGEYKWVNIKLYVYTIIIRTLTVFDMLLQDKLVFMLVNDISTLAILEYVDHNPDDYIPIREYDVELFSDLINLKKMVKNEEIMVKAIRIVVELIGFSKEVKETAKKLMEIGLNEKKLGDPERIVLEKVYGKRGYKWFTEMIKSHERELI